jgi:hypothetical protein
MTGEFGDGFLAGLIAVAVMISFVGYMVKKGKQKASVKALPSLEAE